MFIENEKISRPISFVIYREYKKKRFDIEDWKN